MPNQPAKIAVFDFGGQYAHLIARRVREYGFTAQIIAPEHSAHQLDRDINGIILSGGARSVYKKRAPTISQKILNSGLPVLGICYGHQLLAHLSGGTVKKGKSGEYGLARLGIVGSSELFRQLPENLKVWMNHRDAVTVLPKGFVQLARTSSIPNAAFGHQSKKLYGVQFHPEVSHTQQGSRLIKNFLDLCGKSAGVQGLDPIGLTGEAKAVIGSDRAVIGLSGGVDSAVASVLVARAIGKKLLAVYVDTGLMRAGETERVKAAFAGFPLRLKVVRAGPQFFRALRGVTDPEQKRKVIGRLFVKIFEQEAKRFRARWLVQGTIYSDRIESGSTKHSSTIKSHHNVGGLPRRMGLRVYEPLRELYKDEVRALGKRLGLPATIVQRKVFPGPGLAIRIIGAVTPEKVAIVQRADAIIQEELRRTKFYAKLWMAFPVLLSIKSVGIQGDKRSYKYPIVLRIVESRDAMTANFARLPFTLLEKISTRITNEIKAVNRVVYDISNKPPATMEWE